MDDGKLRQTIREMQRPPEPDWYARARRLWPVVRGHLMGLVAVADKFFE